MISRRDFLLTTAIAALFSGKVSANSVQLDSSSTHEKLSWSDFQDQMIALAKAEANAGLSEETLTKRGMEYLKKLDIHSQDFKSAVYNSYESGNRFWLWQRLIKRRNINGGILNVGNDQLVQLHDHPGATGLVRIISGETEVWQFDLVKEKKKVNGENIATLSRVSHRILRAGDVAVLTPNKGNIHALKAVSKECRMLDFFIPPYERSQRSWYEPIENNWFDKKHIVCRKISQNDFTMA